MRMAGRSAEGRRVTAPAMLVRAAELGAPRGRAHPLAARTRHATAPAPVRDEAALLRLHRLLTGAATVDDVAELAAAVARWLAGDAVSIEAALGLPATRPHLLRIALRDLWLREAAAILRDELGDVTQWGLACRLHLAVRSFLGVRWPSWRREVGPPWSRATRVDIALFFAAHWCDRLPATDRQYSTIVAPLFEVKRQDDFRVSLPSSQHSSER